jgi:hypothetical protein
MENILSASQNPLNLWKKKVYYIDHKGSPLVSIQS